MNVLENKLEEIEQKIIQLKTRVSNLELENERLEIENIELKREKKINVLEVAQKPKTNLFNDAIDLFSEIEALESKQKEDFISKNERQNQANSIVDSEESDWFKNL